jgi:hypothetical protein
MQRDIDKRVQNIHNSSSVGQVRVRTGIIAGQTLEDCLRVQDYWKKEYYTWYKQAGESGRL